jgi:hypothetical protein
MAPDRLAPSMTAVDSIPVTAPSTSATEPPGTAIRTGLRRRNIAPVAAEADGKRFRGNVTDVTAEAIVIWVNAPLAAEADFTLRWAGA